MEYLLGLGKGYAADLVDGFLVFSVNDFWKDTILKGKIELFQMEHIFKEKFTGKKDRRIKFPWVIPFCRALYLSFTNIRW